MLALACAAASSWGGVHAAPSRVPTLMRAPPPLLRVFDVDEAKRRLQTAVEAEDYSEAARLKKEIEAAGAAVERHGGAARGQTPAQPAVAPKPRGEAASVEKAREGGEGAYAREAPGERFVRPLGVEFEEEDEPLVPETGLFVAAPGKAKGRPKANEPWAPEPGKFFFDGEEDEESTRRTEGYWAPLLDSPDRLRASDLNELLHPDHLERLRYQNSPLMAYGALFKWEVLLQGVLQLFVQPWAEVAKQHDLPVPDEDDVFRAQGMRPERAIQQIFRWTDDWGLSQQLAFEHYEAQRRVMREAEFVPSDGAVEWLHLLNEYGVPCCCCSSSIDLETAKLALTRAGLDKFFDVLVTAEDGCETAEQCYLVSAVKVRRPPARCVVFEDDPRGVVSAHEATSKVVAVYGGARASALDMRHADVRVSSLEDLSLMSLRELFKSEDAL